jgi:hypothetical protein
MPITYHRDDARRLIRAVGEGTFLAEDVLGILERMRAERTWSYASLYDIRRMFGKPIVSDLRRLLEAASQPGPEGQTLGPTAVVVTDATLYGMACAYASLGPPSAFEVFQDVIQADIWLAVHRASS